MYCSPLCQQKLTSVTSHTFRSWIPPNLDLTQAYSEANSLSNIFTDKHGTVRRWSTISENYKIWRINKSNRKQNMQLLHYYFFYQPLCTSLWFFTRISVLDPTRFSVFSFSPTTVLPQNIKYLCAIISCLLKIVFCLQISNVVYLWARNNMWVMKHCIVHGIW